jgi:nucleoside-diphosphate-sugar epimerase
MKTAIVCGAGGFIGSHLVKRLKKDGYWVRGVDLKHPEFSETAADDFIICDLRDQHKYKNLFDRKIDEIYQLAADMGGAGYLFTGENDADVMHNSALINLNTLDNCREFNVPKVFYSSSACVYPEYNQMDPENPKCSEDTVYPAEPDSEYGWEKLFSERMYLTYKKNYGINVKIGRFHNIYGPEGTWQGGKEKAPAAMCRKVAMAKDGDQIEVWGDGKQTRSFLYVEQCVEAVIRLMKSDTFNGPVNIGSDEMISINGLAEMAIEISGKKIDINNLQGEEFVKKYGHKCPIGVNGRNSDNTLIQKELGWSPLYPLIDGMSKAFDWINKQHQSSLKEEQII